MIWLFQGVKYWNNESFQEENMKLGSSHFLGGVVLVYMVRI